VPDLCSLPEKLGCRFDAVLLADVSGRPGTLWSDPALLKRLHCLVKPRGVAVVVGPPPLPSSPQDETPADAVAAILSEHFDLVATENNMPHLEMQRPRSYGLHFVDARIWERRAS
jgi:hypothetical protein